MLISIVEVIESKDTKRRTYAELCPTASPEALDLLSKMLVIEPEKRITVVAALNHPFLKKYHNDMFEPNCQKQFDFAFEQELINLHSDVSVEFISYNRSPRDLP